MNLMHRLAVPRGVLTGKEAAEKDLELKEQMWKKKQLEKKSYSHALQENIVVKQVFQEKDKVRDQEMYNFGKKVRLRPFCIETVVA